MHLKSKNPLKYFSSSAIKNKIKIHNDRFIRNVSWNAVSNQSNTELNALNSEIINKILNNLKAVLIRIQVRNFSTQNSLDHLQLDCKGFPKLNV